ncbi:MAG: TonB-dependent receptor [Bacteroidales bacterium]|nr:TonB-dependent receptor [Bacteroidales bacterium]
MKTRIIAMMMVLACGAGSLYAQTDSRSDTTAPFNDDNINKKLPNRGREMLDKKNINYNVEDEEKLVIAVGRSTKTVDELPVTSFVIRHEEIVRNGWVTLCDVLRGVPGFRVSQPHTGQFGEAFIQRGLVGNTYTKILLNGTDIKPTSITGMPLGANIPIRQAERIEILYGPAAAAYGNDACSGVINIVTMDSEIKPFAEGDILVGSGEYRYINFVAGGKFGRGKHVAQFSVYGSNLRYKNMNFTDFDNDDVYNRWNFFEQRGDHFFYKDADGDHDITPFELTEEVFGNMRNISQFSQFRELLGYTTFWHGDFEHPDFGRLGQEAAQTGVEVKYRGLTFSYNYFYRMDFSNSGVSPMMYTYYDDNSMMGEKIMRGAISGDWKFGRFTTNTVLRYVRYRMDRNSQRRTTYDDDPLYMYGAGDDIGFEENINFRAADNFNISAGVSYVYSGALPMTNESEYKFDFDSYKAFSSKVDYLDPIFGDVGIAPCTYSTYGAYGQAVWDWKRLSITGGIRYDNNSKWGVSVNPRIAGLIKITDRLTLRASRAYAYRAPAPQQLYSANAVHGNPVYNAVNSKLGRPIVSDADSIIVSFPLMPPNDLDPEKIGSTEIGLRYYFNNTNYAEFVAYSNRVTDPILRVWATLDTSKYHGTGSNVVPSDMPPTTRTYRNESNAKIKLHGYQLIGVFKDINQKHHLDIKGGITYSTGHEEVSDDNYKGESFERVDYIRQTPKFMAQCMIDFDCCKIMHFSIQNLYCSKWARKYYMSTDNDFYWAPPYYNLDIIFSLKINKNLSGIIKVLNVLDAQYGGIDAIGMDVDLQYNPQLRRNIRLGLTYTL